MDKEQRFIHKHGHRNVSYNREALRMASPPSSGPCAGSFLTSPHRGHTVSWALISPASSFGSWAPVIRLCFRVGTSICDGWIDTPPLRFPFKTSEMENEALKQALGGHKAGHTHGAPSSPFTALPYLWVSKKPWPIFECSRQGWERQRKAQAPFTGPLKLSLKQPWKGSDPRPPQGLGDAK